MSGIDSLSASLAQIFSQSQSTGSSQSTESSSGVEGIGAFALTSTQGTASTQAVDAVSEIASSGQGSVDQLSDQIKAMLLEMQETVEFGQGHPYRRLDHRIRAGNEGIPGLAFDADDLLRYRLTKRIVAPH